MTRARLTPKHSCALGRAAAASLLVLLAVGCDGAGGATPDPGTPPATRPLSESEETRRRFLAQAQPLPPKPPVPVRWQLPAGWSEKPASQFRQGNFAVAGRPDIDCYLSVLPGTGGGILGNVNRWRQQMGLDPIDDAALATLPTRRVLDADAVLVRLEGTHRGRGGERNDAGYALAGLLLDAGGTLVTVKMVGPGTDILAEMEHLFALCDSLRPNTAHGDASGLPAGHPPMPGGMPGGLPPGGVLPGAATGTDDAPSFAIPEGWKQGPAKAMRVVTFNPEAAPDVECYVTLLAGVAGGVDANLNRWRVQLGLAALSGAEIAALPKVTILGQEAPLLDARGEYASDMGGAKGAGFGMLATVCRYGSQSLFVKMTGPADAVAAEKDRFIALCESLGK